MQSPPFQCPPTPLLLRSSTRYAAHPSPPPLTSTSVPDCLSVAASFWLRRSRRHAGGGKPHPLKFADAQFFWNGRFISLNRNVVLQTTTTCNLKRRICRRGSRKRDPPVVGRTIDHCPVTADPVPLSKVDAVGVRLDGNVM